MGCPASLPDPEAQASVRSFPPGTPWDPAEGVLSPRPSCLPDWIPLPPCCPGRMFPGRKQPLGGRPIPTGAQGHFLPLVSPGPAPDPASPGRPRLPAPAVQRGREVSASAAPEARPELAGLEGLSSSTRSTEPLPTDLSDAQPWHHLLCPQSISVGNHDLNCPQCGAGNGWLNQSVPLATADVGPSGNCRAGLEPVGSLTPWGLMEGP